jgi:hypothetical protein
MKKGRSKTMADEKNPEPAREKENNPFSEQEKHGDEAQRRAPGFQQDYPGGQPEERRAPGVKDDRKSA